MESADNGKIDPAVVAQLYDTHGDELRRFLLGILRDPQQASDCLQATFTKMVESGHTTDESSRRAWLFKVAYNEAMAWRRRQAVGNKVVKQLGWLENGQAGPAEEVIERAEDVGVVRQAIKQLPLQQQQVLRMRIYEEKTFAEIAEQLAIPLGTALSRMRQAVTKLRAALDSHD